MASSVSPEAISQPQFQYEPLLDFECTMQFMGKGGITTITFLDVSSARINSFKREHLVDTLKERVASLCHLNPWIAGSLVCDKTRHKNVQLRYPQYPTKADIDEILVISKDPCLCALSLELPVQQISQTVGSSSAIVEKGYTLIKDSSKRVCKVSLCLSKTPSIVSLIFSMSHVVGDGHTYYKLLQQILEADGLKESLSCVRKHEAAEECKTKGTGEEQYKFVCKPAIMINLAAKMFCSCQKAKLSARYIDAEKVTIVKDQEKARHGRSAAFVSTNDILTSTFGRASKPRVLLMAINWRKRIKSLADSDAGNYESCIVYDPESYETPFQIRESLMCGMPIRRVSDMRIPSCCETLTCKISMITNWAFPSFKCECHVHLDEREGESGYVSVPVLLHLPILKMEEVPMNLAIIFRAEKNRLAVFYCLFDINLQDLVNVGAPIGEEIP